MRFEITGPQYKIKARKGNSMAQFKNFGRLFALVVPAFLFFSASCSGSHSPESEADAQEITVAAAANLTNAFEELGKQFTSRTGIKVTYSFGSTANLAKQIENGAPFDVFASADVEHVDQLNDKGLIAPGTRALYARGKLVVWTPPESRIALNRIEDLAGPDVKIIALAKPDIAPYGQASVETLRALNLWAAVEPKVVYGENVAQTRQYASSGNADAAFIPLALVSRGEGRFIEVDERLHQPIDQALALIKASGKQEQAGRFVEFILSDEGQALLEGFGYSRPPEN